MDCGKNATKIQCNVSTTSVYKPQKIMPPIEFLNFYNLYDILNMVGILQICMHTVTQDTYFVRDF
jgi:hypothetical protein